LKSNNPIWLFEPFSPFIRTPTKTTEMRKLMKIPLLITAICLLASLPAHATLGGSVGNAISTAKTKGVSPQLVWTTKGKVIREHWEAPPEMWSLGTAESYAKIIAGQKAWASKTKDGGTWVYLFKNGIKVVIQTFGGSQVTSITGTTKEWNFDDDYDGKFKKNF